MEKLYAAAYLVAGAYIMGEFSPDEKTARCRALDPDEFVFVLTCYQGCPGEIEMRKWS